MLVLKYVSVTIFAMHGAKKKPWGGSDELFCLPTVSEAYSIFGKCSIKIK